MDQLPVCLGQKHRGEVGHIQNTLHSWWQRKIALLISKIDGYVKHIFREHIQEDDHWVNLCAKKTKHAKLFKKMEGSAWFLGIKINRGSGCGVVIKGVAETSGSQTAKCG